MFKQLVVGVVAALMFAPLSLSAQTNTRIGTWKLNLSKSKFEHGPAPKSETRIFTAYQGDGISADFTLVNAAGATVKTTYSVKYDGKDYPYHGPQGDTMSITRGSDGVTTALVKKAGTLVVTTTTSVSADGKTMTQTSRYVDNAKLDVRVLDKQ